MSICHCRSWNLGRGCSVGQLHCPAFLPLPRVAATEPRVCLEAWLQDLHVAHRTHKPERCSSSSGRKLPCLFKSHPPGLLFAFLFALTHSPSSFPALDCCPLSSSLIFTSVSFILKPTEGLVKLCFLSKTNLGARGWTNLSQIWREERGVLYLRFKERLWERGQRAWGVSRRKKEKGHINIASPWLCLRSGAPPLTLPLTSPLSNKKPNQLNLANSNLEQRGLCRSPLMTEIKMVFISYVNILFSN